MPKQNVQYVIKRGITDNVDYNMDGKIDEFDDIVVKLVNGKEVGRKPLNQKTEKRIMRALEQSVRRTPVHSVKDEQRIVYERMPPQNMANPPPVIIKDETGLGQHVKAGFGMGLGFAAADAVANVVGGLFE